MEAASPFPIPDQPPEQSATEPPTQGDVDAGMAEGGRLPAIERRLIHVDRVTEDTLARVKTVDTQVVMLIVTVACLAAMVYVLAQAVKEGIPEGVPAP